MNGITQDLRHALRQMRKSPGFAVAVLLTLALGIGVNTAVFSLVNGFLLRRLPFPEPDRLGALLLHEEGVQARTGQFMIDEDDSHDGETWDWVRDNVPAVLAASYGGSNGANLRAKSVSGASSRYVEDMRVSAHYFEVLGIPLFLGREFTDQEDRPGGPPIVILNYNLWQSVFHGERQVLGKAIYLKGEPYTVVGVLAPRAQTPRPADVWTPLRPAPTGECGGTNCGIIVRLRRGATWQQADAQLSHLRKSIPADDEVKYRHHAWYHISPMAKELGRNARRPVLLLMLAVSFILLIACANLAGLTLVRISRRTPEIATHLALGATRWAVLRQLWSENLLLALLGGLAGLGLAVAILRVLPAFVPDDLIPPGGTAIDGFVLTFTFAASLLTSLLFGALPALQTRRVDLRSTIATGSHSIVRGSSRLRQLLIVGEVGLTVVLLTAAGLVVRTLAYFETYPHGFDPTNIMTAKASLDDARYHEANAFHNLLENSVAAMKRIPGVENAAVGLSVPFERGLNDGIKILDGKFAGKEWGSSLAYVTPEYFDAFRIPMLSGRGIAPSDTSVSETVAVINQDFARNFFDEPDPVGRHFQVEKKTYTVVGVVGNVAKQPGMRYDAPLSIEPVFYVPASQIDQELANIAHIWFQPSWIVRTKRPIEGISGEMKKALSQVDANLPFSGFYSMGDILAEYLRMQRAQVLLLGGLAALALLLSAVGIYALVSNLVAQSTREIGIRLALGAQVKQVMLHVGRLGLIAGGTGLTAGIVLALFAVRVLENQIYGVRIYDPVTFIAAPLLLMATALAATLIPTLRIARIDPAITLREE